MRAESKDGRTQATHILKSYLQSLRIPYTSTEEADLVVYSKSGSHVGVSFSNRPGAVQVNAADLLSPDLERICSAFHTVTEAAGYGRPTPVDRGAAPQGKISYHDDFELVYLRHQILRRTPTPADMTVVEELLPYIKRAATKAFFRFKTVLLPMGFSEADLINIGRVHTLSYLHNYADTKDSTSNIKLFTEFLNQRFAELAKVAAKKALNATCTTRLTERLPHDLHTAPDSYSHFAQSLEDEDAVSADEEYEEGEYDLVAADGSKAALAVKNDGFLGVELYINGHLLTRQEVEVLRTKMARGEYRLAPNAETEKPATQGQLYQRQVHAREELHERLSAMEPERRELVLSYAALSLAYSPDARDVARALCRELSCPNCMKRVLGGLVCKTCGVEAQPRYGVDFLAVRERLRAEGDSLADGMTASLSDSEARTDKKRKTAVAPAQPLTKLSREQIRVLDEKFKQECFAKLPEVLSCSVCKESKPKAEFGARIPRRHPDGTPRSACKNSRCKSCRRPKTKS
jgi:hypothetical protein